MSIERGTRRAQLGLDALSIELEVAEDRPDHACDHERGWFESDYYYPTRLGPVKRAAGAAFDRLAARSSRPRQLHPAER